MGIMSNSQSFKLKTNAAGALEIESQDTGLVKGLVSKATGLFDGGMSGATGVAHTVFEAALVVVPAAYENKRLTGNGWKLPFIGSTAA